jgi:predicted RNA binding protein YcfA (HicA-like mRNA interferase family)
MDSRELLARMSRGQVQNVRFADFQRLVEDFGFALDRVRGSHHIYLHPLVRQRVNIQEDRGDAKAYQLRQFLKLIERYDLHLEGEP